ncbi:transcriptional activator ARO80 [Aspergillus udagawae]|nr:transcriptional activator ARO80 [Aspergillus udagawae]
MHTMWKVEDPMPVHHEAALVEVEELEWYDILQFIESSRQPHYGLDASRNTTTMSRVPRNKVNDSSDAAFRGSLPSVESSTEEHVFGKRPADGVLNTVLREKVTSGNDALKILFDAAVEQVQAPVLSGAETDETPQQQSLASTNLKIDCISKTDVLEIWSGCRFVKMGWFTAREALLYVDLFFRNMAPLSPILTDFFASHHTHYWLITQEPVLCCAILMISSRYHNLPGPSGATRGFFVHNRLWQHCQHLILRIMLGQEKFSKAKTRHLGTVEALLLLSEWYPRALHFPPENDGWDSDLMLTAPSERDPPPRTEEIPMQDRWREDVVEPTRRSDRMSWMLVCSALALAHELGVFASGNRSDNSRIVGPHVTAYVCHLEVRRQRLPALLYVIINHLSFRIGCTSIMPDKGQLTGLSDVSGVDSEWTRLMASWVELTELTRTLRETFFADPCCRRPIDLGSLEEWKGRLGLWRQHHQRVDNLQYDIVLEIEYQYLRVLSNSLGVQGIVERVLSQTEPHGRVNTTFLSQARQIPLSRSEHEFIEEVIDGASAILTRIVSLPGTKPLSFYPIRVFLRVISSSIFILKALALGVRPSKLQESLHLLDQAVAILDSDHLDDIYLVSRYAALLKIHISQLRQTIANSSQVNDKGNAYTRLVNQEPGSPVATAAENPDWDPSMIDWSGPANGSGDWLSLPLDPLMAPFGYWNDGLDDLGMRSGHLNLDFIWNLPP